MCMSTLPACVRACACACVCISYAWCLHRSEEGTGLPGTSCPVTSVGGLQTCNLQLAFETRHMLGTDFVPDKCSAASG